MAIRVLAKLAHAEPEKREAYGKAIDRALRRVSEPREIKARGRMIGDLVLALEESRGVRGVLRCGSSRAGWPLHLGGDLRGSLVALQAAHEV